jgi:hypothetical protein
MKIIAVGDTHGRKIWEAIVKQEADADLFVFMGDYFDTRENITAHQQIENFKNILQFKNENQNKVVLLLGNHDYHYLKGVQEKYSGFAKFFQMDINEVLEPAVASGLLQMCFVHDKFLFTHAGVTNTWCVRNGIDRSKLEESINQAFMTDLDAFSFAYGPNMSNTGDDVTQSPIWVRLPSLFEDAVTGYVYVVGHTPLEELTITDNVIGIDTLGTTQEFLIIEDGVPSSAKLKTND